MFRSTVSRVRDHFAAKQALYEQQDAKYTAAVRKFNEDRARVPRDDMLSLDVGMARDERDNAYDKTALGVAEKATAVVTTLAILTKITADSGGFKGTNNAMASVCTLASAAIVVCSSSRRWAWAYTGLVGAGAAWIKLLKDH